MAILPIRIWPDPVLSQVCAPVGAVSDAVRALAADMLETMYAAPGRGLAAPQVGVGLRLFVMDAGWKDGTPTPRVLVDPRVLAVSDERTTHEEGCLSLPGQPVQVTRPARIRMGWTDLDGMPREEDLAGFEAICAQHEYDHLDGRLILDHRRP